MNLTTSARSVLTDARQRTDKLFDIVRADSLYDRPIAERHRIVFYIGHLEAFDWNLFRPHMRGVEPFNPVFDQLFAFGIDPVDGGLPTDAPSDWPSVAEIRSYIREVRQILDDSEHDPWLMQMAIEHRLMHAETLAYMLHRLPFEQKLKETQATVPNGGPLGNDMIRIPAGTATLGHPHNGAFGWDNEFNEHQVEVPGFVIQRQKVTNGDYLQFIESGGYRERAFWKSADWEWKEQAQIDHPAFWTRAGAGWRYRTMFEEIPLQSDWPVYVSHAEASAYVRWAGCRLPSEAEWHRAAYGTPDGSERSYPWGAEPPAPIHGYFDFSRWDPSPVSAFPSARSAFGLDGLSANGWEWTSSEFSPFPGFAAHPSYPGYSANFFDGKHYVLKGGSTRTAECMLRRSFRNWFQPHYQHAYAALRCVKGD